jgi:hypothetical protein
MSQSLWNKLGLSSAVQFQLGLLSSPQTEERARRLSPQTLPELLSKTGATGFEDLTERREQSKPVALSKVDEHGALNVHNVRRYETIRNFFAPRSFQPDSGHHERLAQWTDSSLDVRPLGGYLFGRDGEALEFYSCRCELNHGGAPKRSSFAFDSSLHEESPKVAIPSSPSTNPLESLSMINPLRMSSMEFVGQDAGAIFCFSPSTFGCIARLYWSEQAFMESLNRVQTIGSALIRMQADNYAAEKGEGILRFNSGSALLAQLYESVAVLGQSSDPLFITHGIWGAAVIPQTHGYFLCQLGIVALGVDLLKPRGETDPFTLVTPDPAKKRFVVANFIVSRDQFGFVDILPEKCEAYPVEPLPWYNSLPAL